MAENQTDSRKFFVPRILPWLLAAAAFTVYCFTLNHGVSLYNLAAVAKTSGWVWQPETLNPLSFIVTYPFRWLPAAQIPVALDLFSATCAALTLGLLARSVALLPQDRTETQREREGNDFSLLTVWSAWLPPVLAVAVCGLQLTFWEQATNCTGEMFDLLLFAFVIWSLLEYRLDEREGRLFLAAFIYGAGMAENWPMAGFFPIFIVAIIWTRGFSFFNRRFLARMALCGLTGMLFYLLLPLLAVISAKVPLTFWQALKLNLSPQYNVLKIYFLAGFHPQQYLELLSPLVAYLMPVFVLSIRWKSSGDGSQLGASLANFMFHLTSAVLLCICIWIAFDPPFSPRERGLGLTFYYLIALSIGYYSGYFLLVFGRRKTDSRWQRPQPSTLQFLDAPIIAATWLIAIAAVAILIYKNAPQIQAANGDTFKKYNSLVEENLPRAGAILLSDDPRQLLFAEASLARQGRAKDFVLLDTRSLPYPAYHKFLHGKFPQIWPDTVNAAEQTNGVGPLHLISLLTVLARTNELYYLHPSFGYYFEQFYLEPHGLVYKLKILPGDSLLPPPLDKNQIAENENFWAQAEKTAFTPIEKAITPPNPGAPKSFGEKLFARLDIARDANLNAVAAGTFYSRSLDFWGVQLQRAGDLTNAAAHFETAQELNPDNVVAQVNLQFNQELRAGRNVPVDLPKITADQFGKYHSWNEMLNENGPFDEPSFCFEEGVILARDNKYFRQAVAPFARVRELVPDNLPARLWLGQLYLVSRLPDRALDALQEPLTEPEKFSVAETNATQLNMLAAAAYFEKNDLSRAIRVIETEISRHPTNDNLLAAAVQVYLSRGLFTNALTVINRKLESTPDDLGWLFIKGYASIQIRNYDDAISALNRVLSVQTNNYDALFNRAVAYLDSDKLDAARADYERLHLSFTNSPQIAYGLGEIAYRKLETNDAIKNYELYLARARPNTAEATNVIERLKSLKR